MKRPRWNLSKPLLAFAAPLLAMRIALPCVPDGGSAPTTLTRPPLPAKPIGAPPGASTWDSGPPVAEEHDWGSSNDAMGNATPDSTGNSATVDVSNSGGDLSGPNGVVQNGGAEGDCIEVQICWYYWTWASTTYVVPTPTGYETWIEWNWVKKRVCNGGNSVEVCPCP